MGALPMGDAWIAQAGDPGKAAMTPAQEAEALRSAAQGQSGVRVDPPAAVTGCW